MTSQPARFLMNAEEARLEVGDVERLDGADLLHVLGLLLREDVDDVVDRDDAEEAALVVDDGHDVRGRTSPCVRATSSWSIVGGHADDVRAHDLGDAVASASRDEELAQATRRRRASRPGRRRRRCRRTRSRSRPRLLHDVERLATVHARRDRDVRRSSSGGRRWSPATSRSRGPPRPPRGRPSRAPRGAARRSPRAGR